MTTTTRTEHGVRHPDGRVEGPLCPNVGDYLDGPELAAVRAKASGGVVVTRTRTVTTTPWHAAGETVWDRELASLERAWAESDAAVGTPPDAGVLAVRERLRTTYRGWADVERAGGNPDAAAAVAPSPA